MGRILNENSFEFNNNTYMIGDKVVISKCNKEKHLGRKGEIKKMYKFADRQIDYVTISLETGAGIQLNQRDSYTFQLCCNNFDIKLESKNYSVDLI